MSSLPRRRILTTAALAGGATVLSACGDDGSGPTAGSGSGGAGASGEIASTSDVPEGGGVILNEAGVVVTQPEPGEYKAFSATCTHQACLVTGVTETIDCICHGSKFSLRDGSVVEGPATEPLPEQTIRVRGQRILLG
jgi:Rieske Fe-S protein